MPDPSPSKPPTPRVAKASLLTGVAAIIAAMGGVYSQRSGAAEADAIRAAMYAQQRAEINTLRERVAVLESRGAPLPWKTPRAVVEAVPISLPLPRARALPGVPPAVKPPVLAGDVKPTNRGGGSPEASTADRRDGGASYDDIRTMVQHEMQK